MTGAGVLRKIRFSDPENIKCSKINPLKFYWKFQDFLSKNFF
jgi:hypothetical protein